MDTYGIATDPSVNYKQTMKIEKDKRKKNIICLYNACGVSSKCVEDSTFHLTQNTATLTPFLFFFARRGTVEKATQQALFFSAETLDKQVSESLSEVTLYAATSGSM